MIKLSGDRKVHKHDPVHESSECPVQVHKGDYRISKESIRRPGK